MCLSTISTSIKLVFTMSLLHFENFSHISHTPTLYVYIWSRWQKKGYHEVTVATVEHYTLSFIPMNLPLFTQSAQIHTTIERSITSPSGNLLSLGSSIIILSSIGFYSKSTFLSFHIHIAYILNPKYGYLNSNTEWNAEPNSEGQYQFYYIFSWYFSNIVLTFFLYLSFAFKWKYLSILWRYFWAVPIIE